jgi:hypothetical protein
MSVYYDIELIDINENVENFNFERISSSDLTIILESFKKNYDFLEFKSSNTSVLLERKYFRGIMYIPHTEKQKTVKQETLESAEEIAKIEIKNKGRINLKG